MGEMTARREPSLDIYRGLTIFLMILANTTSMMRNLPWWMNHSFNNSSHLLHVAWLDLISPMFMFIMGAAIPLAVASRLARGTSSWRLAGHILVRAGLLIWIGTVIHPYYFRSADAFSEAGRGAMGGWWGVFGWLFPVDNPSTLNGAWYFWGFVFPVALLATWPLTRSAVRWRQVLGWAVRVAALGYLVWASFLMKTGPEFDGVVCGVFRGGYNPKAGVFESYGAEKGVFPASILGYLGFAYLEVGLLWLIIRRGRVLKWAALAILLSLMVHLQHRDAFLTAWLGEAVWYIDAGARFGYYGSMVLAGALAGEVFLGSPPDGSIRKSLAGMTGLFLLVALLAGGDFFRTFQPASIRRTLFFIGLCCAGLWLVWEICRPVRDAKYFPAITSPLTALGKNPLFAYMLSYGLAGGIDVIINSPGAKQWIQDAMNVGYNIVRTTSGYIHFGPGAWWLEGWWGVCLAALPYVVICTAITMLANRLKVIVRL
ncbi:MAG: DUF5009 domain-containing protein [Phycisphaerae bacterium]|nr:DUF5009 domain-containing protein [Phycisphaerae bacterium]